MKNIVAYYRLSKKSKNGLNYGIETQKMIVHHFYKDRIVKEYYELLSGGELSNREQLKHAIQFCIKNNYTLAVAKVDRLSRKTEDVLSIYSQLEKRLVACDLPNFDKFTLTLHASLSDKERELIKIRTKSSLNIAKNKGVKLGNPRINEINRQSIKLANAAKKQKALNDPNNRKASGYIKSLRKLGLTFAEIASKLNQEGFTTRTGREFWAATVRLLWKREVTMAEQTGI
jgi:DNA invertase Pin-like site-specific DNA recombinase